MMLVVDVLMPACSVRNTLGGFDCIIIHPAGLRLLDFRYRRFGLGFWNGGGVLVYLLDVCWRFCVGMLFGVRVVLFFVGLLKCWSFICVCFMICC